MYTVETSLVLSIIIIALSYFINFSFNIENKIRNYIDDKYKISYEEYNIENKKKFTPEKIQKIITSIGENIND